ncbi:MAG: NAD(P)/FAD-dependent oxidoreductase [Rubripirellula sp.]
MSHQSTVVQPHRSSVLVIGGGVAGSACALRLRSHGIEVALAEKAVFPRAKVCGCCIGGAGIETFDELGVLSQVTNHGVGITQWQASIGGKRVQVELPSGVAISRETLDTLLLDAARDAGCEVITPCTATLQEVTADRVSVRLDTEGESQERSFDLVVVAAGLNGGGVNAFLPWTEKPHGPFGVAWSADCSAVPTDSVGPLSSACSTTACQSGTSTTKVPVQESLSPHVIYMACDDDGYVGLVRLENDRVDIAAALRSGSAANVGSPRERVVKILDRSQFPAWAFRNPSDCLTTPPLRRTRQPGKGRLIAIGDAAGYSEPFTGEGMTWAMQSAIACADLIAESAASGSQSFEDVGDRWQHRLPSLLRRKKLACRAVTSVLRWPAARRAVGSTLARWPSLAEPLIRHLSQS